MVSTHQILGGGGLRESVVKIGVPERGESRTSSFCGMCPILADGHRGGEPGERELENSSVQRQGAVCTPVW